MLQVTLRVDFLSTPFYDDHFDLYKDSLKLGKTFVMVAKQQGEKDLLCSSYELIGYGLYEKFEQGLLLLEEVASSEERNIAQSAVSGLFTNVGQI